MIELKFQLAFKEYLKEISEAMGRFAENLKIIVKDRDYQVVLHREVSPEQPVPTKLYKPYQGRVFRSYHSG